MEGDPIGGWSPNDLYQQPQGDFYTPPYAPGHTGWTLQGDYGRQLVLKDGNMNQFSAGWANLVDLPGSTGGAEYAENITTCNTTPVAIARPEETCTGYNPSTTTEEQALNGCLGSFTGNNAQTELAVGDDTGGGRGGGGRGGGGGGPFGPPLVNQDPGARWDPNQNLGPIGTTGGVVDASGQPNMDSPRVRPIAVFDVAHYIGSGCTGTPCSLKVVNIIGFFVDGMCYHVRDAGMLDPGVNCGPNPQDQFEVVGRIVTLPPPTSRRPAA